MLSEKDNRYDLQIQVEDISDPDDDGNENVKKDENVKSDVKMDKNVKVLKMYII